MNRKQMLALWFIEGERNEGIKGNIQEKGKEEEWRRWWRREEGEGDERAKESDGDSSHVICFIFWMWKQSRCFSGSPFCELWIAVCTVSGYKGGGISLCSKQPRPCQFIVVSVTKLSLCCVGLCRAVTRCPAAGTKSFPSSACRGWRQLTHMNICSWSSSGPCDVRVNRQDLSWAPLT